MSEQKPTTTKREPAPGELALVQAFVNTVDLEDGTERLRDRGCLRAWLLEHDLIPSGVAVSDADLRLVLQVREALRALAMENSGGEASHQSVDTLNRAAESARLAIRFDEDGRARLEPRLPGVDGALGRLLGIVYTAMVNGTWRRLKACRRDTCRWLFYDRSKNRSSTWCQMAVCGNREKAKAYRRRRRNPGSGS